MNDRDLQSNNFKQIQILFVKKTAFRLLDRIFFISPNSNLPVDESMVA